MEFFLSSAVNDLDRCDDWWHWKIHNVFTNEVRYFDMALVQKPLVLFQWNHGKILTD